MAATVRLQPPVGRLAREDNGQPEVAALAYFQDVADRLVSVDAVQTAQSAAVASSSAAVDARLIAVDVRLTDLQSNMARIGEYLYSARGVPPPKFIAANGATVSRTDYAQLFAQIGTTYGVGDGSTTFKLPNPPFVASTFIFIRFSST